MNNTKFLSQPVPDWDGRFYDDSPTVEEALQQKRLYVVDDPHGLTWGMNGALFVSSSPPGASCLRAGKEGRFSAG